MKNSSTNPMDDIFKQHFDNTTTAVVKADDLWAAIQEEREPKKRAFVWWYFALGAMLLGLGAYYLQSSKATKVTEPIATTEMIVPEKAVIATAKKEATTPIAAKESQVSKTEKKITNKNTFAKASQVPLSDDLQSSDNLTHLKSIKEANINLSDDSKLKSTVDFEAQKLSDNLKLPDNIETVKLSGNSNLPVLRTTQAGLPDNVVTQKSLDNISILATLPLVALESAPLAVSRKGKKWDKCQVRQRGALFMNAYGQSALAMENLTMTDDNASNELLDYKSTWEEKITPFVSYMGGVQLGYNFSWNGYISAGVAYQHFQTKYENIQKVTERITVFDEMAYFYLDANGETVWVADSVTQTNVYDRKQTFANNHKLWHIPLQVGYTVDANQLRLGANIEALVNISKQYEGYFLQKNGSVIELDTNNEKDFMSSNIGVSLSLGLHAGYRLGEHWEAYLSPRFRLNNQSYLNSDQSLKLSNHFAGLRAGLQYHF